jgi:hypothetical protein
VLIAPVIVDLGPDVGVREAQIVLDACNDAISNGVCLPEGGAGDAAPRAVAVARAADRRVLVVRIEVRLRADDPGSSIVRELEFARRDPLRERWRSVGLAIATLVGEGEQREREEQAASEPEPVEPLPPAEPAPEPRVDVPEPPPTRPPAPATRLAPAPAPESRKARGPSAASEASRGSEAEVDRQTEASDSGRGAPFEHRPVFIGLGVLAGPGFGAGAWRAGGNLRAGWHGVSGWQLATSLGFAWRTSEESFTASWASLDAGVGYRLSVSDAVDLGALFFGGVQRARFEVLAAGVSRSDARLNPRFGLGADARWRPSQSFGAWAAADASSSGRQSRLFLAPDRAPISDAAFNVALLVGIGWWVE